MFRKSGVVPSINLLPILFNTTDRTHVNMDTLFFV